MRIQLAIGAAVALSACATSPTGDSAAEQEEGTVNCVDGPCVLSGTFTEDLTLARSRRWVLHGPVYVGDEQHTTVLTIQAGTTIVGDAGTDAMLVIRRGSRLEASGTPEAPIVFTSSKAPGERARGDWGGIVLNGRAPINDCSPAAPKGCEQGGEGATGLYGGQDPNDTSGTLRYVRVEFAGRLVTPDVQMDGIAFRGVGRGTTVNHVQVHMGADDGVQFSGGTVDFKHVLVTGAADDALDWSDGWRGRGQFFVGQQYGDVADNGIEANNNDLEFDAKPRSHPVLSNVTLVGSPDSVSSDLGVYLRAGTAGDLYDLVVAGFNQACLALSDRSTLLRAEHGALAMRSSLLDCTTLYAVGAPSDEVSVEDVRAFYEDDTSNLVGDAGLADPFDPLSPDFAPLPSSPAVSGGETPDDPFFRPVGYRGAVEPTRDWTVGWTTSEPN